MLYPNDANGDVLRRMEAQGDDLTKPRNIDFTVTFADAISAEQFAEHFRAFGHKVSVRFSATDQDFPWYVIVVQHMVPSHEGITDFENLLQSLADGWGGVPVARRGCASWGDWGGHNDGWGCFSQPRSAPS